MAVSVVNGIRLHMASASGSQKSIEIARLAQLHMPGKFAAFLLHLSGMLQWPVPEALGTSLTRNEKEQTDPSLVRRILLWA